MLICRFNGVAWFHDLYTIAYHREKQVVFPVAVLSQRDLSDRHKLIFGGARLPNSPMILTKLLARLKPAYRYAKTLAEPPSIV